MIKGMLLRILGVTYRCRCGALVQRSTRHEHEDFHESLREFFSGPTADEMAACRASLPSQALIEGKEPTR
jgi:hypothetical protein